MFGSTQKIQSTVNDFRFDRKIPLFWYKMISVAIFTSKYFQTQTHTEREREREIEKRNRKPRNRLRLRRTQKPTPLNPKNPRPRKPIRQTHSIAPRKPIQLHHLKPSSRRCTTGEIVAPQHRSTQNRSFSCYFCWVLRIWVLFLVSFGFCPRPSFIVLDPDSLSPFIEPSRLSLSLSLSLNLTEFDEFFLLGFVSFVFIY